MYIWASMRIFVSLRTHVVSRSQEVGVGCACACVDVDEYV